VRRVCGPIPPKITPKFGQYRLIRSSRKYITGFKQVYLLTPMDHATLLHAKSTVSRFLSVNSPELGLGLGLGLEFGLGLNGKLIWVN